jgi:hypothetical protein
MNANRLDPITILMFFIMAAAGFWVLLNSRRFADMTWMGLGIFEKVVPKTLVILAWLFYAGFGVVFIGLGLFIGITSLFAG